MTRLLEHPVALGVGAGVVAGALYTVAPVLCWAAAAAWLVVWLAGRGLPGNERRLLVTVVGAALAVRLAAVGGLAVAGIPAHNDLATGALSGDEAYNLSRALRTRDVVLERPVTKYDHVVAHDEYGRSAYVTWLAWVQVVAGPTPYSMRVFNAVLFVAGALLLFHVARRGFGSLPAFGGLALLLALPSLAWSSISLLKEPLYFLCAALLLWGALEALKARTAGRMVVTLGAIACSLLLLDDLRRGALILTASGIALALAVRVLGSSRRLAVAGVAALVIGSVALWSLSPARERLIAGLESAAKLQTGHVFTVGHAYKLLDDGFYVHPQATAASTLTLTPPQAARFVLRGAASFLFTPLPWQMTSRRELAFLPELLLWYVVLALVPVGVWAGWRRSPLVTSVLLCFPLPTAAALALTTGNVGTLLRLRGLVWPYLIFLAAVGLSALIASAVNAAGAADDGRRVLVPS